MWNSNHDGPSGLKEAPSSELRGDYPFNFHHRLKRGPMLLVGEENMSFSLALAQSTNRPFSMIATTHERVGNISPQAKRNADALEATGVRVLHGIDATRLETAFSTVVFQFPNTGDRRSAYGSTSNHHLVRRFLASANRILVQEGLAIVTTVDSPHYHGVFDIPKAAEKADLRIQSILPFYRSRWDGYSHCNTRNITSALRASYRACTWVLGRT